jgi:hypothetical protein
MILAKSTTFVLVASRIFAMLSTRGQRGRPLAVYRFDRLKVVKFNPLARANAVHDIPRVRANFSMAFQMLS